MKKNCAQTLELLQSGYLDNNELEPSEREAINLHLAECSACRSAKENLAAILLALHNTPRVTPPENLWPRIQKEIRPISGSYVKQAGTVHVRFTHFLAGRKTFAFAAAAVMVITATIFYLGASRTDNGETTPSLTSILGSNEIHEPDMNFGSAIEKYFL